MGKYLVVVESDTPPRIYLDDTIPNVGRVVEIKAEVLPKRVGTSWLLERVTMSKTKLIELLRDYNLGSDSKHLYDPEVVLPILMNPPVQNRRGRKRIN